ncbi:SDR family NAD(P)-dependent oxidoreductase [Paracandidimonas lactea]|uniref:SDR family NAD(P)-dependent oxidoreductase n=1 Tax=Paracandidimonas lactea TaxID=2895524 RepID=UPI001F1D62E1|nr:SDR family NAD(P)-dependent oxidoreductase [Paracandidimonas lactea]
MRRFEDRVAVVTGAASGLGRDIAISLCREGAAQVVLMDINPQGLAETAELAGSASRISICDVSDPGSVATAWQALQLSDGLDVLVTAAGTIGTSADIEHCAPADWDRLFAINVRGTYLAVQQALPYLRIRSGCIVTMGSTAGLVGSRALGPYSASKGAITTMTRSLALAHAADGIRVNCVCPGSINTPMLQATFDAAGDAAAVEARKAAYLARYPMGRFGEAHEVAEAVLFLASSSASYMTGVMLPVDGGVLA